MAASSNIVIDPKSLIPLSKELKEIKDVLIAANTYSEIIQGSIHRIEKGGFLDFVSKKTLKSNKVKDRSPEKDTTLKKLVDFLDQKIDKTGGQKIETPTDKIVQPTIFKSIIQSTHKLVEDITSKSIEEYKKTKYSASSDNKDNTISNVLSSQLKQISSLFNKKNEPIQQKTLNTQLVSQDKQVKDINPVNNGTLKQITALLDANKPNKADIKNVDVKKDDNSLQKILKSIELLASSKKDETPKSKEQDTGIIKKLTSVFEGFKNIQSKNLNIKVDDSALQKVIKSFSFFSLTKQNTKPETPQSTTSNIPKSVEQTVKQPTTTKVVDTNTKPFDSNVNTLVTTKETSTNSLDRNDNFLIKKLSAFFDNFKPATTLTNKTSNVEDSSLQKILKTFALLRPSKPEEVKPVQNKPTNDSAVTTNTFNNRTTQNINVEDNFLQKILKALDQKNYQKDKEPAPNKQNIPTNSSPSAVQSNSLKTLQAPPLRSEETVLQKILKSIEFLKPSKKEEPVKTSDQSESLFKKMSLFLNDFKSNKNDIKGIDIKKDDSSSLQKVLKSIEFLKPSKKEEPVKTSDQSVTLFKKLEGLIDNKFTKNEVKVVDTKKDDNGLQKILKSIEFLKPSKKEEPIKTSGQSESVFKKMSLFLNDFKSNKNDNKGIYINKDDNSLQKILKSIEFLKPSKKEEPIKTSDQSESVFKKMSLLLNDSKSTKSNVNSVDIKKDDNSLQKILKSIEFLKPSKKEEPVKTSDQSDTLFKKMSLFLNDFKSNKNDIKSVDIKKDDNSLQKILKSIEFLKPSKKEEPVKTSDQSESLFKKMSSFLKENKTENKSTDIKESDNSLQKVLKSIAFLRSSKKEENTKAPNQSEETFKNLTTFLKENKNDKTKDKTDSKSVGIKEDDSSLQKVLKSIAFLRSPKKKEEVSKPTTDKTQEQPKNTKQSFISSSITAVKEKLTNAFSPKPTNNEDKSYGPKDNAVNNPNIVERINSFKISNEKQLVTEQDKNNSKSIAPVSQKLVEQKNTTPVVTQIQPLPIQATTSTKLSVPLAPAKTEGEAQKELFAKEDIDGKILKTLEHIDRTAKEILKTISGKHQELPAKKEKEKEKEQTQSESPGASPLDLLDLIPGKLKQRARIFAKKGIRAARKLFTKGKSLLAKGGGVLKSAAGKAITAGKTLITKAAGTAVGSTVAKGATALKTVAGNILEKGGSAVKNVTSKALDAGKDLVGKITNTGVIKNAGETISKGASNIKTAAGNMLEKGGTAVKNVTSKALDAGKDLVGKVASPETVKNVGETISKGASNIKTAAGNMLEKGGTAVKNVTSKALDAGKGLIGKIMGAGTATAGTGVTAAGQVAQAGGTLSKVAGFGTNLVKGGGKVFGFLGKAAKAAGSAALKVGKVIPGVGGLIGTGMAAYGAYSDIQEINEKVKNGEMTAEEATIAKSKAIGKGIGSAAGSFIPGVGGIVGDLAGGFVGDKLGGVVGNALVSNKKLGEQNTLPTPEVSTSSSQATVTTSPANNTLSDEQPKTATSNSVTPPPTTTAVNSSPLTAPTIPTELKSSEPLNVSKETLSTVTPTLDNSLKSESLWDKAKNIGTKAIQYATPVGAALTAGTAIYNKLTTPTTTNAATPQTTSIPTPSVAKGADSHQALKQVAESIASSNSNDKDLAASILKMSEALVSAGLMKAPPIELNNIIQGNNSPPKINLEAAFGNNNDPIRSVRSEFAV